MFNYIVILQSSFTTFIKKMNYNIGGPSNIEFENELFFSSSSSSSSSNDEGFSVMQSIVEDETTIYHMLHQNQLAMQDCYNQQNNQVRHGGSIPGHIMINHDREAADRNLYNDYFCANPRYNDGMFRQRYRMSKNLFLRIVDAVKHHDSYFQQQRNCTGRLGLSTLQKTTAVFRMLAYGLPVDVTDEYVKIGESTAIESLKRFCRAVVEIFAERYLRSRNSNDIARLLYIDEQRGFPGILGSLDCMHWKWKNCPTT